MMDTGISYCSSEWAYFYSDERRWQTIIKKLADSYPDECIITIKPEDNGGVMCAKVLPRWMVVRPPRHVEISDERRAALSERARTLFHKRGVEDDGEGISISGI